MAGELAAKYRSGVQNGTDPGGDLREVLCILEFLSGLSWVKLGPSECLSREKVEWSAVCALLSFNLLCVTLERVIKT